VKIEIAVQADLVSKVVDAIIRGAKTGKIGDGKVFVTALEETVRIRTDERGEAAL
jgi:nitrogen regulatory protein P-II 1